MPSGKREAQQFRNLASLAAQQPQEIRQRRRAAEQAYTGVLSRLGAKGTYENVGGTEDAGKGSNIFRQETIKGPMTDTSVKYGLGKGKATVVDPKKLQKNIEGSAQFRIMSRMTAEAEQLLAREGPLYDEMLNNLQLPIIEGAGAMARENAEALKRAAARGGAARRNALEAVQKIRAQERINSQKVQALSQTRFALDQWSRENARTTLEFGQNWASNLGGIRESFNQSMDQASQLMLNSALPIMFEGTKEAAKWRYYAHQKQRDKVTRWISGIMGVGSLVMGGMGAMGGPPGSMGAALQPYAGSLTQSGAGFLGGAMRGTSSPAQGY